MARVRLSVDVDPTVKHRLAVLAALRRTTISEIVIEAVQRVLAEDEVQSASDGGTGAAGALARYADSTKRAKEEGAWSRAVGVNTQRTDDDGSR